MKIEDIKRDREVGALWVPVPTPLDTDEELASARRIARVPELEAAFLEAVEVIEAAKSLRLAIRQAGVKRTPGVYQAVMHYDAVAKTFLERFK